MMQIPSDKLGTDFDVCQEVDSWNMIEIHHVIGNNSML